MKRVDKTDQPAADALAYLPATELKRLLMARQISVRELLDLYLARVEKLNPAINAVVALDVEGAKRRAWEADEGIARGDAVPPLHGLPMTIKDAFEVVGMPATCGLEPLRHHRPERDADAVARLRRAGAIIFGKTNLPAGATDHQSYNSLFGITRNPWNPERTPGGSSGGSAAALAAGMTALEPGSDIGGSIRVPSHFCGVYGHKPSYGIVSRQGHIPPPPGVFLEVDLAVVGPMARSPEDLEMMLDLIIGPRELERGALTISLPPARHTDIRQFRVALWADSGSFPIDQACREAIENYAEDLRRLGVRVDETKPELDAGRSYDTYLATLFGIIGASVPEETLRAFAAVGQNAPEGSYEAKLSCAVNQSLREWMAAAAERENLYRRWRDFFRNYDVLLCPITPTVAFPHDTSGTDITAQFSRTISVNGTQRPYLDNLAWPGVITVANLPATAVPTRRFVGGLPVGLQIVGPYMEDRTPLRFAQFCAREFGGFMPPPL